MNIFKNVKSYYDKKRKTWVLLEETGDTWSIYERFDATGNQPDGKYVLRVRKLPGKPVFKKLGVN